MLKGPVAAVLMNTRSGFNDTERLSDAANPSVTSFLPKLKEAQDIISPEIRAITAIHNTVHYLHPLTQESARELHGHDAQPWQRRQQQCFNSARDAKGEHY